MNLAILKTQVFYLIFFSLTLLTFPVNAQKEYRSTLIGKLVNSNSGANIYSALIYNSTTQKSTVSDSMGIFAIHASPGDTLKISRLGYFTNEIAVTSALLSSKIEIIELSERSYELKNVNVLNLGTYEQFKFKVLNTKVPITENNINELIARDLKKPMGSPRGMPGDPTSNMATVSLGSPITGLYNLLSKEGRSARHLEKQKEKDRTVASYAHKYSPAIVSTLTGLKELELEKFMKFCNLSVTFIQISSEYDIAEKIVRCLEEYKASKESIKTDSVP